MLLRGEKMKRGTEKEENEGKKETKLLKRKLKLKG
jgi:hypothetical protein